MPRQSGRLNRAARVPLLLLSLTTAACALQRPPSLPSPRHAALRDGIDDVALRHGTDVVLDHDVRACFEAVVEERGALPLDRFHIELKPAVVDEPQMRALLAMLRRHLDRDTPFTVFYDLRSMKLGLSSRKALLYGNRWMSRSENSEPLDRRVRGVCVAVSSPLARRTAQWCISLCDTPAPVHVVRDAAEARRIAETWGAELRHDAHHDAHHDVHHPHVAATAHDAVHVAREAHAHDETHVDVSRTGKNWWGEGSYYQ